MRRPYRAGSHEVVGSLTTVLVTDADYQHALAAIRNIGRHGARIIAASSPESGRAARGLFSRYVDERIACPTARTHPLDFVQVLAQAAERHRVDVVLPIGGAATAALSQYKGELPNGVALPILGWDEGMSEASDKQASLELARRLGISVPRNFDHREAIDGYPVVVKPRFGQGGVRYAVRPEDALFDASRELCQEYIPGDGYGYFGLFERGVERAFFMHRRVREYPVTGGSSTAAESFFDPVLREFGSRMLRELKWHGVAMVEFKKDRRDGVYKLMEINPKFWGSLDLAIEAGVEFPWLAVKLALGQPLGEAPVFKTGLRFQWICEDFVHVLERPASAGAFVRDLGSRDVRNDFRKDDLKPFLAGVVNMLAHIAHRVRGLLRLSGRRRWRRRVRAVP